MADNSSSIAMLRGGNPVLARELRVALRNERAFALMALYVAILGAIVASQFPDNQVITIEAVQQSGAKIGADLFWTFCQAQFVLVLVLLPGLAAGALAQERERQTLEPLLLSPLTPLQIVWGKAVGVMAFTALLLLATVPLTSLCFLLGGVSPDMVVAAYVTLLGLAALITAFGLYCSARWQSATQATIACYALLPFMIAAVALFSGPGSILAGVMVICGLFYGVFLLWRRTASKPFAQRLGVLYNLLLFVVLALLFFGVLWALGAAYRLNVVWVVFVGVFIVPYFLGATYLGLGRAASELARAVDPRTPTPQRIADFKEEWKRAVEPAPVVYLPAPTGRQTYATQTQSAQTPAFHAPQFTENAVQTPNASLLSTQEKAKSEKATTVTYGVKPFLSDKLNPVFAKDLRAGFMGKFAILFRYSYVIVILTEVLSFFVLLANPEEEQMRAVFSGWSQFHLALLMIAGAVFGARALAPEREQQTLPQLLTTPLLASEIVRGKMMAVMVYTFYVFVMGVPFALILFGFGIVSASAIASFFLSELVYGAFAAAFGLFCSLHGVTVRRALGWALSGILGLIMTNTLLADILRDSIVTNRIGDWMYVLGILASAALLPFTALSGILSGSVPEVATASLQSTLWLVSMAIYALVAVALMIKTGRDFKRYAQTV